MESETVILPKELVTRKRRKSQCSDASFQSNVHSVLRYLQLIKDYLTKGKLWSIISAISLGDINGRVATLFNISTKSVHNIMKRETLEANKENASTSAVMVDKGRKKSCQYVCDDFLVAVIRRTVQGFYARKEYPDIATLLTNLRTDENFPPISKSTLYTWMRKHCKMKYRRINKKPVYLERTDIRAQRETYLRLVRKYRDLNYNIYYSDETWASPDHVRLKCWQMLMDDDEFQSIFGNTYSGIVLRDMEKYVGGFITKSAAGRVIINHIGSVDGFLQGGDDVFISKKDTKDYHGTMNFERYQTWFTKILQLVPDKSVLVLDQAPYHRKRVPSTVNPTMAWRKAEMIEWLVRNNISVPEHASSFSDLTKVVLLQLARENPLKPKFIVEDLAENCGKDVKILWLPVAHCEFNPIELIWAGVKGYVAKHNTGKNIQDMLVLVVEALATITPEQWKRCVGHAIKYEDRMWQRDRLLEEDLYDNPTALIIHVEDGDTTSASESEDDLVYENDLI